MLKNTLVPALIIAVITFSSPRGAAAYNFDSASEPLAFTAATVVPEAAVPATAAPKACKPFLLAVSVGGVDETVAMERVCTPENEPIWALVVNLRGKREISVRVASDKYPEERSRIESRIKSMVTEGINRADARFIVAITGPALKKAEAAAPEEKTRVLAEATEALKVHLSRP